MLNVSMLNVVLLIVIMLNVIFSYCYAECHYAECRYAECHYAEYRYAECRGAQFLTYRGSNKINKFSAEKNCEILLTFSFSKASKILLIRDRNSFIDICGSPFHSTWRV